MLRPETIELMIFATFFGLLITAVYTDLSWNMVPNWATYTATVLGVALHLSRDGVSGVKLSAMGFLVGFGIFLILYAMGMLHGADVKLMGAIGALMGWEFVANTILHTALIGGVVALGFLAFQGLARMLNEDREGADVERIPIKKLATEGAPAGAPAAEALPAASAEPADAAPDAASEPPASAAPPDGDAKAAASGAPAPTPEPSKPVRKAPPSTIPYGVCIALGGFATFYLQYLARG